MSTAAGAKPHGVVYKITNLINGKVYIGITRVSIKTRWRQHKCYRDDHDHLHNAFRKYGLENFKIEQIDSCVDEDELQFMEKLWIFLYGSQDRTIGYNVTAGGEGASSVEYSAERRLKMSLARKGIRSNPSGEFKKGCRSLMEGKRHTPETKRKMAQRKLGKKLELWKIERRSKLTQEKADEIRHLYDTGNYYQEDLAYEYDISRTQISNIINNKQWVRYATQ